MHDMQRHHYCSSRKVSKGDEKRGYLLLLSKAFVDNCRFIPAQLKEKRVLYLPVCQKTLSFLRAIAIIIRFHVPLNILPLIFTWKEDRRDNLFRESRILVGGRAKRKTICQQSNAIQILDID